MAEFVHPLTGLMQGVQQGAQLGLQMDAAKRQRKQQEWENDFRMISAGLNLAQTKGVSPESRAKILNESVGPAWKKWTGTPFPEVTAQNAEAIGPLIKNLNDLGKQAGEGKIGWDAVYTEANNQISNFHVQTQQQADVTEKEKSALDAAMAPIKAGYETSQAAKKKQNADAKTPDEVMKEIFDINTKLAGMQQLDQQTANLIQIAPEAAAGLVGSRLSPEQLAQVKGAAAARMMALNDLLPADKKLVPIDEQEYQALVSGNNPMKRKYSPEEIFRTSFVLPVAKKGQ